MNVGARSIIGNMADIQRLLADYRIPFATEGNAHCTQGWVNIHCPFCHGSQDYHLGIHEDGLGAHCWRCGAHSVKETLSKVLGLPEQEVTKVLQKYNVKIQQRRTQEPKVSIYPIKYPEPNSLLTKPYKDYLAQRGFDPEQLIQQWDLRQTGPSSYLDNISYSYRILIPVKWNGEMVSFQARDVTGKSNRKYMACPKRREKVHHKDILYGKQEYWQKGRGTIVVEGVPDVWRLGPYAAATFGMEFKMEQVLKLAKVPGRLFIVFDSEPQAQKQARELAVKLKALGKEAYIEKVDTKDPGDMKEEDAKCFVRSLIGRRAK